MNGTPQGTTYRELKTVLFADVAGYSRLTELNEELTHNNLCARYSLISHLVHHHNGVIHRTEGDSVLATFASATSALQCAVEIQNTSSEQNLDLSDEENLSFRIGINCGEVLIDSDEAFGKCVNIAKRLESLAEPGEIVFSEPFFTHVHRTLPYKYKYLGKKNLKNLQNSLKVYSISLHQESLITNYLSIFQYRAKNSFLPVSAFAISTVFAFFLALQFDVRNMFYDENSFANHSEPTTYQKKKVKLVAHTEVPKPYSSVDTSTLLENSQKGAFIYEAQAKFVAYEKEQNQLAKKYELQKKILSGLAKKNKTLIAQQKEMRNNFSDFENKLISKNTIINSYSAQNNVLIEANKELLTRLDEVVSKQVLDTYENLYAEYNPVRQQIIEIIESQPKASNSEEDQLHCSIYTNNDVQPQSLESTKGSIREELRCSKPKNKNSPIPQSKLAEPKAYKKDLAPKEKKVVIYAYIPKLPHKTSKTTQSINNSIVELYEKALSESALQSYKTKFVLLSPPTNDNDFASLDSEHCDIYEADYVASVRLNKSHTSWPVSSALVVHDCATEVAVKRDTRHLLSDSWNENGGLYLTPSTLDSFNLQVHSIIALALNHHQDKELKL